MTTTNLLRFLLCSRLVVGTASWLAPRLTWRAVGLGAPSDAGSSDAVTRLFGARDLALGLALLQPDPAARRAALRAGVVVDSVDTVAGLLAVRAGAPRPSLVGVAAGAALLATAGLLALRDEG